MLGWWDGFRSKGAVALHIVPVIDLQQGVAVHGVGGQRDAYQPVRSRLVEGADPHDLAVAFAALGLTDVYVADLDGIRGQDPDWATLRKIADSGARIWLDAGVGDLARAHEVVRFASHSESQSECQSDCLAAVIVGLESVADPRQMASLLQCIGPERAVFSLDLKLGEPLAHGAAWQGRTAAEIAAAAWDVGFRRLIVLDLAWVGQAAGVHVGSLCQNLLDSAPWQLVAGGGVRSLGDLQRLASQGCQAALVATALHQGQLSADDLRVVEQW
jgi:phosphoribosylformimino-5-aminoimidazole carboxamide ribotide isomerase